MKKNLIAFLLLLANLSFAQNTGKKVTMDQLIDSTAIIKWISENSYNMEKGNNVLAYKEIDSIARVKKIIGLGEPAHGVKTIYENRNELAKYLIQNCNYNIIALEMHFNVGIKINEYITTGKGNLKEILKSGHFFTNCQEYIDFFEWLKDYNSKTNKKVMVYGMDIQSNIDLLEDLFLFLNKVDKNIKESTDNLDKLFKKRNIWEYSSFKKAKRDSVKQCFNVLVQKFENSKTQYIRNSDDKTYALNNLRLTVFKNFMQLNESFDFKSHDITEKIDFRSLIIRDSCNAQLICSISKLEGENSKMIVMAHSGHLCKNGFLRQMENTFSVNGFYKLFKPTGITGWWLNEMIGSDYYFIGYQIGQGKFMGFNPEKEYKMESISITPPEFPSVNYHLSKVNKKYYFLPMNFNKDTHKNVALYFYSFQPYYEIGAANDLKYMQTNAEYYDAIIYCNDVEASVNYTESE